MSRKYINPKEVQENYGISVNALKHQRWGGYGFPYTVVGRKKNNNRGGHILYNVDIIEKELLSNTRYPTKNKK